MGIVMSVMLSFPLWNSQEVSKLMVSLLTSQAAPERSSRCEDAEELHGYKKRNIGIVSTPQYKISKRGNHYDLSYSSKCLCSKQ